MSGTGIVRRGTTLIVPEHAHTGVRDGGKLSASLFTGQVPLNGTALSLTGQTAAITTTNLAVAPAPGDWLLFVYLEVTTHTTNGTITVTIGWTDTVGATTDATVTAAFTATGRIRGILPLRIASGNLTYAVAIGTWAGAFRMDLVPVRLT